MSMDWIHLGISGFTKEDTIDESPPIHLWYRDFPSLQWFQVAQSQKCDKIPNESLARLLILDSEKLVRLRLLALDRVS